MKVAVLAVVAVMLVSVVAVGQPAGSAPGADAVEAEAEALVTAGKFLDAAAKFREAYRLDPRPDLLCNVGVAFHKAKDLPRSQLYLGECLQRAGSLDADVAVQVRNVLGSVEDKLRAGDFAPVDVSVTPDTASFTVSAYGDEDRIIGARLVWLPFGTHTFVITAEGHVEQTATVEVKDRTAAKVEVTLERAPVAVPDRVPGGDPIGPAEVRRSRRPAIIATVATAVVGGAAVLTYLLARSKASQADDGTAAEYDGRVDTARRYQHISWGLAGAAGVGAAISGYLWYRSSRPPATRIEVAPTGDGAGATVWFGGRF